jgi:hypothetical protein
MKSDMNGISHECHKLLKRSITRLLLLINTDSVQWIWTSVINPTGHMLYTRSKGSWSEFEMTVHVSMKTWNTIWLLNSVNIRGISVSNKLPSSSNQWRSFKSMTAIPVAHCEQNCNGSNASTIITQQIRNINEIPYRRSPAYNLFSNLLTPRSLPQSVHYFTFMLIK